MDANFVREALLQHNYFPNHKTKSRELPPSFHTNRLTPAVAQAIVAAGYPSIGKYKGCDYTQYTLTRFNGGPRVCGIPHPFPYCVLVERIHKDWHRIEPQLTSDSSAIQAKRHPDGRLFVMDYGGQKATSDRYLRKQSCAKFIAKADIANFYPSLYTHSIPWAIVGIDNAKANTSNSLWYNALDRDVRLCRRSETNGVSIGPGTSSLMAEIVLTQIDRKLQKIFSYDRFIDDYTCFCKSRKEAEDFLRQLESELAKFNLFLNFRKTAIKSLPDTEIPDWIDALGADRLTGFPDFYSVKMFLSRALHLTEKFPDGSVLRYAIHSLNGRVFDQATGTYILRQLLSFALSFPHVVSSIEAFLKFGVLRNGAFRFGDELVAVARSSALARRSDAICWSLWLARRVGVSIPRDLENEILKTYDTFGLVALYQAGSPQIRRSITTFTKKRILSRPASVHERNWFLLHYLLNTGRLLPAEVPDPSLLALHAASVNLFD